MNRLPFELCSIPFYRVRQEGKASRVCSLVIGNASVGLELTMRVLHAFAQQLQSEHLPSTYSGDPCLATAMFASAKMQSLVDCKGALSSRILKAG